MLKNICCVRGESFNKDGRMNLTLIPRHVIKLNVDSIWESNCCLLTSIMMEENVIKCKMRVITMISIFLYAKLGIGKFGKNIKG